MPGSSFATQTRSRRVNVRNSNLPARRSGKFEFPDGWRQDKTCNKHNDIEKTNVFIITAITKDVKQKKRQKFNSTEMKQAIKNASLNNAHDVSQEKEQNQSGEQNSLQKGQSFHQIP